MAVSEYEYEDLPKYGAGVKQSVKAKDAGVSVKFDVGAKVDYDDGTVEVSAGDNSAECLIQ